MIRFAFAIILILISVVLDRAIAAPVSIQDQYLQIYLLIQETDKLEANGQKATARERYQVALDRLKKLRADNKDWEPTIVNYRINYCQSKISSLRGAKDANPNATTLPLTPEKTDSPPTKSNPAAQGISDDTVAFKQQIADLRTKLASTTSQLRQARTEAASLRSKVSDLEAALQANRTGTTDEKTAALLAENQRLNEQLTAAQATISNLQKGSSPDSLASLQEQLKKVQNQLAQARQENEALRQSNTDYRNKLAEAQRHLDAANARLASTVNDASLQKENTVLRDIIQREMAEQARREIAKRIALEELHNLSINSDKLQAQINLLSSPLIQLTEEEKAMLKGSANVQLNDESLIASATTGNFSAKKEDLVSANTNPAASTNNPSPDNSGTNTPAKPDDNSKPAGSSPADTGVDYATQAKVPAEFHDQAKAANNFFGQRKFDEAAQQYQDILGKYPNSLYALSNLGVVRFQQQNFPEAEKYFRQATNQAKDDAFSHSMLGITLYQEGKYDEAVQVLTRATALAPGDARTHNFLGISASQKGWQESAEQECRKAVELDPQYGDAHFNLAVIYATQRPPARELARRHYERALELGIPRDPQLEKMIYAKDAAPTQAAEARPAK